MIMSNMKRLAAALTLLAIAGCASVHPSVDYDGFFKSAQIDDARTMRRLLSAGIDLNRTDKARGDTGMILALREDSNKVFKLLLEQPGTELDARSGNGDTALMMASFKHNRSAVIALLARGAKVNRPGWTALHYAAASGDETITALLLEHHAFIDAESPTMVTPLMIAAREGQERTVKLLLARGADASLKSSDAMTAAQIAMNADKPAIAKMLNAHLKATRAR
jgi:ankyrin repeat protein